MNEKIAIYWWAFNPPTLGHFFVINEIFKNTDIDKILIVPDWDRDDKDYKIEKKLRKDMIELFVNILKNKWLNVWVDYYFFENKNNSKITTTREVDLYFKEKLNSEPWHIFWTDISWQIKKWSWNPNKYIEKTLKKIFIKRKWFKFINNELENYILINPKNSPNISSTTIRENCKNNIPISNLLFKEIEEYIIKYKIYK